MVLQPRAGTMRQHEQRIGDDRTGNGRLHSIYSLPQGGQRNEQFGQVPSVDSAGRRLLAGLCGDDSVAC